MEGCLGCNTTAGENGCSIHSSIIPFQNPPPFVQIFIRCPCCGQDMKFDGFKLINSEIEVKDNKL